MGRTEDPNAREYRVYREGVKNALRSYFDKMIRDGKTIAIAAKIGCGVNAQEHKRAINADFNQILNEVLDEGVGIHNAPRRDFFSRVILAKV